MTDSCFFDEITTAMHHCKGSEQASPSLSFPADGEAVKERNALASSYLHHGRLMNTSVITVWESLFSLCTHIVVSVSRNSPQPALVSAGGAPPLFFWRRLNFSEDVRHPSPSQVPPSGTWTLPGTFQLPAGGTKTSAVDVSLQIGRVRVERRCWKERAAAAVMGEE